MLLILIPSIEPIPWSKLSPRESVTVMNKLPPLRTTAHGYSASGKKRKDLQVSFVYCLPSFYSLILEAAII
jgi:hypothetical protein